jgi:uncharacterized protein (TIGR02246 family)
MTTANSTATDETLIRNLVNSWANAIRNKDSDALMSNFAPDAILFDVINPLQYIGTDAGRKRAEQWLSAFQGPVEYEIRNLTITTADDVAFCHSLNRVNGTTKDGKKIDMWWRATVCFRKMNGQWMVTHEHSSVPFDMESGKASLDLKP